MEKEQLVSLVTKAQGGEAQALNCLFNEFYNDLYYFALKTVKDDETALDVTQEAFVEIINTLGNLKEPAAFVTWAKQITYHQCTRYFKKKKDVLAPEDEEGNTVFDTLTEENAEFIPDEALDKADFKKTVMAILDELSVEQRSATMMYYFDEMSVKQIAEIQGVSEGTVKSRLNYARKAIKASVEDYEKKHNIKLHAIPFFPFFKWIFEGAFEGGMPVASAEIVAEGVTTATGTAIAVSATTGTTAAVATATTAGAVSLGAKIAAMPIATKIIAGVVAATIAIGGGTTAVILSQKDNKDVLADNQSIVSSTDTESNTASEPNNKNDELVLGGIIPEGCTYTLYDGTVLTAGQKFPETCTAGDKVSYGDYLYGYECVYAKNSDNIDEWFLWKDHFDSGDSGLIESDVFGSWSVIVADQTKTSYGIIASKINGKPIKTLYATFYGCTKMTEAPKIPSTITAMTAAYYECTALTTAPVIPNNVERIMLAFQNCYALTGDVVINAKLDKSLEWFYSETFTGTVKKLNLIGETAEKDLILIAKHSDNRNITVNGKRVDYGSQDTSSRTSTSSKQNTASTEVDSSEVPYNPLSALGGAIDLYCQAFNFLPPSFFDSTKALTIDNATIFTFSFLTQNFTYPTQTVNELWEVYTIPLSDMEKYSKNIFGVEYDFTTLNGDLYEGEDAISSVTLNVMYDAKSDSLICKREKQAVYTDGTFACMSKTPISNGGYSVTYGYGYVYDTKHDSTYEWIETTDGKFLEAQATFLVTLENKNDSWNITSFTRG